MGFSKDQIYCVLDYETFSEAPLRKVGGSEYSLHPSTEVVCVAWAVGTKEQLKTAKVRTWAPVSQGSGGVIALIELLKLMKDPAVMFVAHNALFEQLITRNVLSKYGIPVPQMPPYRWVCTAALAAALAVPRKLEHACQALKLPFQKDMEGHKLMMKWCKPRKPTKKNPATRHTDLDELNRLVQYCAADVKAEIALFLRCPPLNETERKVWELDQAINHRGFQVDRELVTTILKMIEVEKAHLDRETDGMTFGEIVSATQRDGVLAWLENEGVFLPNLRKKTVEDAIRDDLVEGDAKRMLELRLAISKTSTAKYQAYEMRSRHDGRLRDILLYWAASPGRWGGMGIQPQNFPRGSIKNTIQASEILREGDLEMVRLLYGDPMSVFSSCLRNMIVAPEGTTLDVADYAAIEARVLFWMARHDTGVKAFVDGRDMYKELATKIFNVPIEKVTDDQRFVGKQALLGCGYSMGWKKFMGTCENLGRAVSEDIAKAAVTTYRTENPKVVAIWGNIEKAAIAATKNYGKRYTVNRTSWFRDREFLYCELPSGRRLSYYGPRVMAGKTPWGSDTEVLYHWGVNPMTKKWNMEKTYGGRLVENCVQGAARDLMAEAMLRIEARGPWRIVLSVHDELIAERTLDSSGTNAEFQKLMAALPSWAEGCPVTVAGWEGVRYRK